jgi:diguanylate cyclase (GGDEF)-like protein
MLGLETTKMITLQPANRLHRFARVNYLPRALGFFATFFVILLLAAEQNLGTPVLLMAVACFLLYPHLAFLHTRWAGDSRLAEQRNLLVDSVLLGAWAAVTAFNLWLTFALLITTLTNNALQGGPLRLALATGCFVLGAATWVLVAGPGFQPHASVGVTIVIILVVVFYLLGVALTSHRLTHQLAQAHTAIVGHNKVFRSLLKFSEVADQAADVGALCERSLDHFTTLAPGEPFGLLLFERDRPRQLRISSYRGLPESSRDRIYAELVAHQAGRDRGTMVTLPLPEGDIVAVPLTHLVEQVSGYVVMGQALAERLDKLILLFADQLASALQNKLLNERLRQAAETDSLTGTFNRRYMESALDRAIANKRSHKASDFAVIMLDLVGLKQVNDTLGHEAGDRLIVATGNGLMRAARNTDVVARFGGDEFVVLCLGCRESDAEHLARRLVASCERNWASVKGDQPGAGHPCAISVGVAGSDRHDPDSVLTVADARMYQHKQEWYRQHGQDQR